MIRAYRATLSPDHGIMRFMFPNGVCRHYPSCSGYAVQAIERYGAAKGAVMGIKRVLKCNPLFKGGLDPVK